MDLSEMYGSNFLMLCQIAQETRYRYWSRNDIPDVAASRSKLPPGTNRVLQWDSTTVDYRNELARELLDKLSNPCSTPLPAVYDTYRKKTDPSGFVPFANLHPVEQFEHQLLHSLTMSWQPAVASEWDAMNRAAAKTHA